MSGHNKWSQIQRQKGAADAKRGKVFTRIIKEMTVAARLGGGDPDANPRLRTVVDQAKAVNMPAENIKRAIRRGTGEEPGMSYEEVIYEGYGPGGVALIVEAATDNRNRTVADLRYIFSRNGGHFLPLVGDTLRKGDLGNFVPVGPPPFCIVLRQDCTDSRQLFRPAHVDLQNPGAGMRAAENFPIEHIRQL